MNAPLTPERMAAIRARQARMPNGHNGSSQSELLDAVADRNTLLAWVDLLLRWKSEATEVLAAWERVWVAAGEPGPLGESKAKATAAEVARLRAQTCGASRPDYPSVIPCMLPPHDDRAPHWSTSGCAGGAVQWFNQELDHWPHRLPPRGMPEDERDRMYHEHGITP